MSNTYTSLQQPVLTSLSISVKDDDAFFNPVGLEHTGFAYDGFQYTAGTQNNAVKASWYTEEPSVTRGVLATFPTEAVVVVSAGSMTILDASSDSLDLWMLFHYCDTFAFPNNFPEAVASFSPSSASFAAGRLSIVLTPDPGSQSFNAAVLTIDFAGDTVYLDYPQ